MMAPKDLRVLISGTFKWQKGFCGGDEGKDLYMGRWPRIIWGPFNAVTHVFSRERQEITHGREGRMPTEAKTGGMWPQAEVSSRRHKQGAVGYDTPS